MIDHDRLFKEVLQTFFLEFLHLFLPHIAEAIDPDSIEFLDKELFTDVTSGDKHLVDFLVRVTYKHQPAYFLIHVEHQAQRQVTFGQRFFCYFSRLYEKYQVPIYPIAIFSYDKPHTPEPNHFEVAVANTTIMQFTYHVIHLQELDWQDYAEVRNPIASAFMAKMRKSPEERAQVKVACLRSLAALGLDPARVQMISGFIDTYLRLETEEEHTQFQEGIATLAPQEQEATMEIVTSWMEEGIQKGIVLGMEQGRQEGRQEGILLGESFLVLQILGWRFGPLTKQHESRIRTLTSAQIEALAKAQIDFTTRTDLDTWLDTHAAPASDAPQPTPDTPATSSGKEQPS
jgi:hypothetical protein